MDHYKYRITEQINVDSRILIEVFDGTVSIGKFSCGKRCAHCIYCLDYCQCPKSKPIIWINPPGINIEENYRKKGIGLTIYRLADIHFSLRIMPDKPKPISESKNGFTVKSVTDKFGTVKGSYLRKKYESEYGSWELEFTSVSSDKNLPIPEIISLESQ